MKCRITFLLPVLILCFVTSTASAGQPYVGFNLGRLATSPGDNGDSAGYSAVVGYREGTYDILSIELEYGSSFQEDKWEVESIGVFAAASLVGIEGTPIGFKIRMGFIRDRIKMSGTTTDEENLAFGFSWLYSFGSRPLFIDLGATFRTGTVVGTDELAFFSVGVIYAF